MLPIRCSSCLIWANESVLESVGVSAPTTVGIRCIRISAWEIRRLTRPYFAGDVASEILLMAMKQTQPGPHVYANQ